MLRKILSALLIMILSCTQIGLVSASLDEADRELLRAREALMEMRSGELYISELDRIMPELSTTKLSEINARVQQVQASGKLSKYAPLLNYMELMIQIELDSKVFEDSISTQWKEEAQREILAMQSMLADSVKDIMKELMISWEETKHYEEKWDLSLGLDMNYADFAEFQSSLKLSDYTARTQMFNQEFDGQIEAFLKGMIDGESVDIELKTLMDFISKDGNMYLLLEQLQFNDFSQEKEFEAAMKPFIEKLQELWNEKTYLSFEDIDAQEAIGVLQSFSAASTQAQIDELAASALFEAYNQEWNTYILRPSLHFCNMGKSLSGIFDPFYWSEVCSDGQYQEMLRDFQRSGISLSLTTWNENMFRVNFDDYSVVGNLNISWEGSNLSNVWMYIYDPRNQDINNMRLDYIPRDSFKVSFNAENEFTMSMDMLLDVRGGISSIDMMMQIEEYFDMTVRYSWGILDMDMLSSFPGTELLCTLDGALRAEFADLVGSCTMVSDSLQYMFPGEDTLKASMDLLIDTRWTSNSLDMNLGVDVADTNIMNMDIVNTGTRKSITPTGITLPAKTIDVDEAFEDVYKDLYGDYSYDDDYGYDPYYSEDANGNPTVCEKYEYNEEENYDICTQYVPASEEEVYYY